MRIIKSKGGEGVSPPMAFIKKNISVIVSIVIALIAGLLVFTIIRAQAPTVPVVVANQNMRVGTVLKSEYLTVKNVPAAAAPGSSFRNINQVVDSTIINGPIIQGDMLRAEHLSTDGSLLSTLKTFSPDGWTAVELPEGAGIGMRGLKRGDSVYIIGEVGSAQGIIVDQICSAIVLNIPDETATQYVVAVPDNYSKAVAEIVVRGKPVTLTLPSIKPDTAPTDMTPVTPPEGDEN